MKRCQGDKIDIKYLNIIRDKINTLNRKPTRISEFEQIARELAKKSDLVRAVACTHVGRSPCCQKALNFLAKVNDPDLIEKICDLRNLYLIKKKEEFAEYPKYCSNIVGARLIYPLPVLNKRSIELFFFWRLLLVFSVISSIISSKKFV